MTDKHHTILLVDDDPDLLLLMTTLLGQYYEVVTANNADEGYEQLTANNVDLIICDIMMPAVNGLEFISKIREETNFVSTPVIMLTSSPEDYEMPSIASGADVFCQKSRASRDLPRQIKLLLN